MMVQCMKKTCRKQFPGLTKGRSNLKNEPRDGHSRAIDFDALKAAADVNPTIRVKGHSRQFDISHTTDRYEIIRFEKVLKFRLSILFYFLDRSLAGMKSGSFTIMLSRGASNFVVVEDLPSSRASKNDSSGFKNHSQNLLTVEKAFKIRF